MWTKIKKLYARNNIFQQRITNLRFWIIYILVQFSFFRELLWGVLASVFFFFFLIFRGRSTMVTDISTQSPHNIKKLPTALVIEIIQNQYCWLHSQPQIFWDISWLMNLVFLLSLLQTDLSVISRFSTLIFQRVLRSLYFLQKQSLEVFFSKCRSSKFRKIHRQTPVSESLF